MEVLGIGKLGQKIPSSMLNISKQKEAGIYVTDFVENLQESLEISQLDESLNLPLPDHDFIFQLLYFTGKWNQIYSFMEQVSSTRVKWDFILAISEENLHRASLVFEKIIVSQEKTPLTDWMMNGWIVRYFGLKGQYTELEKLVAELNFTSISQNQLEKEEDGFLCFLYNLGSIRLRQHKLVEANELLTLCMNEGLRRNHDFWLSQALMGLSIYHSMTQDFKSALNILREAIVVSKRLKNPILLVKQLNNEGAYNRILGKYEEALTAYQKAQALANDYNLTRNFIVGIQVNIADILALKGQYNDAEPIYQQYLQERSAQNDHLRIYYAVNQLGVLKKDTGDFQNALFYFERGLTLSQKKNEQNYQAIFLNNLGRTYAQMGDYENSEKYLNNALNKFQAANRMDAVARVYSNLSVISFNKGNLKQAKVEAFKALEFFVQNNNSRGQILVNFSLTDILLSLGNYQKAQETCIRIIELAEKLDEKLQLAVGFGKLGEVYFYLQDNRSASLFQKSLDLFQNLKIVNGDYAQVIFHLIRILIEKENWNDVPKYLEELTRVGAILGSQKVTFLIQFVQLSQNLLLRKQQEFLDELDPLIPQLYLHEYFQLYTESIILKIKFFLLTKKYHHIQEEISKLLSIAQERGLFPLEARCNYLYSLLKYREFDLDEAIRTARQNLSNCRSNQLTHEVSMYQDLLTILEEDSSSFKAIFRTTEGEVSKERQREIVKKSKILIQAFIEKDLRIYISDKQVAQ